MTRIFVVGGGSTRLRLGTRSTQTWREAAILPYGANHTVYHAAIHARDGRVRKGNRIEVTTILGF